MIGFAVSILLAIINRSYNTLSKSTTLSDVLLVLFVLVTFFSFVILFVYGVYHIKYKNSYIQIHNGKIKYRNNSLQNTFSEYREFSYYKQYTISLHDYEIKNQKLVLRGDITLELLSENEYVDKTKKVSSLVIPPIYTDWDKVLHKISDIKKAQ